MPKFALSFSLSFSLRRNIHMTGQISAHLPGLAANVDIKKNAITVFQPVEELTLLTHIWVFLPLSHIELEYGKIKSPRAGD
jgi:hypothetical protein